MKHAVLMAAAGLAACAPGPDGNRAEPATTNEAVGNEALANVAQNAAEPAKSILRPEIVEPVPDWNLREKFVVAPLLVAFLFLGFYPKPALDLLNPAVSKTLAFVGVSYPAPTNAADGSAK